jgi:hypothetical protein
VTLRNLHELCGVLDILVCGYHEPLITRFNLHGQNIEELHPHLARPTRMPKGSHPVADELAARRFSHVTVRIRPGGHEFPATDRELAYEFLASVLG